MKKVLLVLGASGALGRGVAEVLIAQDYAKVYLFTAGTEPPPLFGTNTATIPVTDLANEQSVADAFDAVKADKNTFFFLFSSIGGYAGGTTLTDTSSAEWERMLAINLNTHFLILRQFSRLVKASAGGSACVTSAYTAFSAESLKAAYGTSKAALNYLVQTAALEGEGMNLSVNAIAPFILDTPANRSWVEPSAVPHLIQPREVGNLVHALFTNFNFVSGNIIALKHRFPIL